MLRPSMVEFHPQWLRKQATDGWANTFSCGAHSTIFPRSATLSSNPSGNLVDDDPLVRLDLTTHKNGWPLSSRPNASSSSCWGLKIAKLPNATQMTEPEVCLSSQLKQVESSGQKLPAKLPEWWLLASKGPIGKTLGINFKADGSSSSNELERIRLVNLTFLATLQKYFIRAFPLITSLLFHGISAFLQAGISFDKEIDSPFNRVPAQS